MGQCLVTKLKGSVDNPNLERLGYITVAQSLHAQSAENNFNFSEPGVIYFKNCTYNGARELSFGLENVRPSNSLIVLDEGETQAIYEIPLYTIKIASFGTKQESIDAGRLSYAKGGQDVFDSVFNFYSAGSFVGDVHKMIHSNIRLLLLAINEGEVLDITDMGLPGNSFCNNFNSSKKLTGCADNIGFRIGITDNFQSGNTKNVTLTVENFVRNAVTAGTTTKTLNCPWFGAFAVYFDGNQIENISQNTLSWEPYGNNQTKITLNGTEVIINNA